MKSPLISAEELQERLGQFVVVDCRFSLTDVDAGEAQYREGHIPGAHYLHLERDMSAPPGEHGGRHPLPDPDRFTRRLAELGIERKTPVVAYDDNSFAFAARLWWMMRALDYADVQILDGDLKAWSAMGGELNDGVVPVSPVPAYESAGYSGCVDIEAMKSAQRGGAILVDSREERRYQGLEEPIDPVAGHIPGAVNYPWQGVSDEAGFALPAVEQAARWRDLEGERELVLYCGSGVTACVNILSLALSGRTDVRLYAGSWSDWCSYMEKQD